MVAPAKKITEKKTTSVEAVSVSHTELVQELAMQSDYTNQAVKDIVSGYLDKIIEKVKEGSKVSIKGIGLLSAVPREARIGRNPRTGEETKISAKNQVKFKISSTIKKAVNE